MLIEGPIFASAPAASDTANPAMIGPNAILQSVAVMREVLGQRQTDAILADAQIAALPSGDHMVPELDAIRLHRWLAMHEPAGCYAIAEQAGLRTADYIIANRIPKPAVWLLRQLPAALTAPLLMMAIRQHAWTFIGAGNFEVQSAWRFSIDRKGARDPVFPPDTLFHWYAAVFTRLYRSLVSPDCLCRDTGAPDDAPLRHHYVIEMRRG